MKRSAAGTDSDTAWTTHEGPWGRTRICVGVMVLAVLLSIFTAAGQSGPGVLTAYPDPGYDVVARPTDLGAIAPFDLAAHHQPNIIEMTIGRWQAPAPADAPFTGSYANSGGFGRLDIAFEGLINPPGRTSLMSFDPFAYGPNPVYGFIEFDVDLECDTGGETDAPQYRYLANIARFGGLPEGNTFDDRVAAEGADLDGDFTTEPYIERSGEEFHLALLGSEFYSADITEITGDADLQFEAGETWDIVSHCLHRAHGFEPYSLATGGSVPGEYELKSIIRFSHNPQTDITSLSLVFPLTNMAAGALWNETPQSYNHDPSDHASIFEALRDLRESAVIVDMFPSGQPEEALILGWQNQGPGSFMDPQQWRVTALVGTTYTAAGYGFIWTDAYPNVLRGNVDGEDGVTFDDEDKIEDYIELHDAEDGATDERVVLADFATDFAVYDLNHDGIVETADLLLVSAEGDADGDNDVDLADFARYQQCAGLDSGNWPAACGLADLDADGAITKNDHRWFVSVMTGPTAP